MPYKKLIFSVLFVFALTPMIAFGDDGDALDGNPAATTEISQETTDVPDDPDTQQVVQTHDILLQLGWDESNQDRRQEIFQQIDELKNALTQNLDELSENYQSMKENEQSFENRMLSGLTMAATGIGGMELARGLAEKDADKDAAADMAAYMATFQCKIGDNGKKIDGGDTDIATPGANQLIDLYQSYVDLAASLKQRKADLGIRAGIEAEVVLDKSATGLYDDTGTGVNNGTYASLYRAAMGNQTDIDKLDAQSDATTRRVGIGGAVAAAGIVTSVIANQKINQGKHDKSQEILAKREEIKNKLDDIMQSEIEDCNAKIQDIKQWAQEQKNTPEYKKNSGLREYVTEIEKLNYLTAQDGIDKLVNHLICD